MDTRSASVRLVRRPTGLAVEGEIPEGHYSRNEMREKRLQQQVARHLRILER